MPPEDVVLPWTLRAAVALVCIEALVEAVVVARRTELTVGLRVALILCIGLKWLFGWRVLRLRAGALFGLLLLEGTTVLAAIGATESAAGARVALGAVALAVLVLLSSSLHAFPSPTLPKG
jgi:hypothetical protein